MGSYTESRSLLEALEGICNIDVDSVDPSVAKSLPFKPHNRESTETIAQQTSF